MSDLQKYKKSPIYKKKCHSTVKDCHLGDSGGGVKLKKSHVVDNETTMRFCVFAMG